jgi:hypothetical protein
MAGVVLILPNSTTEIAAPDASPKTRDRKLLPVSAGARKGAAVGSK